MKDEYLFKMYYEFLKANGIKGGIETFSKYEDMFIDWIAEKEKSSRRYAGLVNNMGIEGDMYSRRIAEFGKGQYDSAMPELAHLVKVPPIAITPYASTLYRVPGIEVAKGRLVSVENIAYVAYDTPEDYFERPNCHDTFGNNIGTLMTQQPFKLSDIRPYLLLLLQDDKTIFLGTNGSIDDQDKKENIESLYYIYQKLQDMDNITSTFESEIDEDSYLASIKAHPRVKIKGSNVKKI